MADVEVYHEVSCPGKMSRFRSSSLQRCTARKGLWLHLEFNSDVRVTVRLNSSATVIQG